MNDVLPPLDMRLQFEKFLDDDPRDWNMRFEYGHWLLEQAIISDSGIDRNDLEQLAVAQFWMASTAVSPIRWGEGSFSFWGIRNYGPLKIAHGKMAELANMYYATRIEAELALAIDLNESGVTIDIVTTSR